MTTIMEKIEQQQYEKADTYPVIRTGRHRINRTLRQKDLATLYNERAQYHKPDYQREKVLSYIDKQLIFVSIVVGIPLDPLQCKIGLDPNTNSYVKYIMNGWQRYNTYLEIMENKVTMPLVSTLNHYLPNSPIIAEVEHLAGLTLNRLGEEYQQDVREFDTWIVIMGNVPPGWEPDIFALVNRHRNLTIGNRLASRISLTNRIAAELTRWETYDFWSHTHKHSKIIIDDKKRSRFASVLQMLMIEAAEYPYYLNMREETMMNWSSGVYDHLITDALVERVIFRMTCMDRVFHDMTASTRTEVIAMYQACRLLEDAGFALEYSEPGCLTKWLTEVKHSQKFGTGQAYSMIAQLGNRVDQQRFWEHYLPWLTTHVPGLVKREDATEEYIAELATSGRL